MGHLWVQKWFKILFSRFVPRPLGVLKQVFLARFEPMVARNDAPQSQKALKMGFWVTEKGQKWVKKCFSRMITKPFGVHKQVKWARFEPIVSDFGVSKVTKCLEGDVPFPPAQSQYSVLVRVRCGVRSRLRVGMALESRLRSRIVLGCSTAQAGSGATWAREKIFGRLRRPHMYGWQLLTLGN